MVDNNHIDIYKQLKSIYDGCDTILDALPFCNMYVEKYPHMKKIIISYTNGKIYNGNIDIKTKQNMLNDIFLCDNKDEANIMISILREKTNDDICKRAMDRIANCKLYHKREYKHSEPVVNIRKKCPHCDHVTCMEKESTYVICGYTNPTQGYDWNGCGKDWCFQCKKILCKSWEGHKLLLKLNRTHTDVCCSKHARDNGHTYPNDYCQCSNLHVHREANNIMKNMMYY
jgi:hypothetical protein